MQTKQKSANAKKKSVFINESPSSQEKPVSASKKKQITKKQFAVLIATLLVILILVAIGVYYYLQYENAKKLLRNPYLASEQTQETLVARLSQLTQLPDEQPTIAKVTDMSKLHNQPFFQKAKDGDYVLIYPKAKEAILYDPVDDKVVQVSPVTVNNSSVQGASTTAASSMPTTFSVALFNGTTVSGLARKVEGELAQKMPNATVVATANAAKQDYQQTIVVDLTGRDSAVAAQLAVVLHGTVGVLPNGEVKPQNTDIMVILGRGAGN